MKSLAVLRTVRPVTHTADADVNKLFTYPIEVPLDEAIGKFKSILPISIKDRKPSAKTCGGFNLSLNNFFLISISIFYYKSRIFAI